MLEQVADSLLQQNQISIAEVDNLFNRFSDRQFDYADLYFQSTVDESWSLEDSMIKTGGFHIDSGLGVRMISGEKTGFAYSDLINLQQLQNCADIAKTISPEGDNRTAVTPLLTTGKKEYPQYYAAINPVDSITREQKIELLHLIDRVARAEDKRVIHVNATVNALYEEVLIAASDGTFGADIRPLVRISISVLVEQDGKRERGSAGAGGRFGLTWFFDNHNGEQRAVYYAKEAVRQALVNLHAKPAPAGSMPVILGAGWPGVLLHEAVGHGLEGDFNRKETSVFSGKIGEQVTSPLCTIVDDGTIADRRGSMNIDDEGTPTQRNVLIKDGVLQHYMQDKLNARLMGMQPTGNGRRESYACLPMPRMTNTFMLAGESKFDDMIASVEYGLYAPFFAGGQVDITSGKFVFSTAEAYLIENGKITQPVNGATLIGSGIDVMQQVSMVGDESLLDEGIGVCGKDGQSVPVGVGQPALKIDNITVGGTQ